MWLLRPLPLLAVVVATCLAVAGAVSWHHRQGAPPPTAPHSRTAVVDDRAGRALDVLDAWDRSRAAAYASGDVEALRRLYVRGAPAGRSDARVLGRYAARGLAVTGLELQRSELEVLLSTRRRLRVEVVERVAGGTVVAGRAEVALPADRPERRLVTLVRADRGWRVAAVLPSVPTSGVPGDVSGARPGSGR